jgi:MFS family permease
VSALTNKYGCRPVCIGGAFVASAGFALSSLSTNLYVLCFTYGIIGGKYLKHHSRLRSFAKNLSHISGIGFGLVYLPTVVCVAYYFESKRAFATGLAACGSGVGTFIFAPLSHILLGEMSWQKTNLIFSAMILLCGVSKKSQIVKYYK